MNPQQARKQIDRLIEAARRASSAGRFDEVGELLQQAAEIANAAKIVHSGLVAAMESIGEHAAMIRAVQEGQGAP